MPSARRGHVFSQDGIWSSSPSNDARQTCPRKAEGMAPDPTFLKSIVHYGNSIMATVTSAPTDPLAESIDLMMHPYRGKMAEFTRLPAQGLPRNDVLQTMESLRNQEEAKWKQGFASGAVYNGD